MSNRKGHLELSRNGAALSRAAQECMTAPLDVHCALIVGSYLDSVVASDAPPLTEIPRMRSSLEFFVHDRFLAKDADAIRVLAAASIWAVVDAVTEAKKSINSRVLINS